MDFTEQELADMEAEAPAKVAEPTPQEEAEAAVAEANREAAESEAPPVSNEFVAPGCELFSDETIALNLERTLVHPSGALYHLEEPAGLQELADNPHEALEVPTEPDLQKNESEPKAVPIVPIEPQTVDSVTKTIEAAMHSIISLETLRTRQNLLYKEIKRYLQLRNDIRALDILAEAFAGEGV